MLFSGLFHIAMLDLQQAACKPYTVCEIKFYEHTPRFKQAHQLIIIKNINSIYSVKRAITQHFRMLTSTL